VSTEETTDANGRNDGNVVIGNLKNEKLLSQK
jgi:hypothetical protein